MADDLTASVPSAGSESSRAGVGYGLLVAIALAVIFVVLRSLVWILYEQAHFDSDQAVVGLMAKHLAEGRALPLFFYGQHYMLAVEAWLAAPLFWLFGPSVAALKLPLLGLNLGVAVVLVWLLVRRVGISPLEALAVSCFFLLAPPIPSSRFVEAQGSNIEPLLYVLLLWIVRNRPIAFGLLAGFAFLHREFSAYAIAAIVLIEAVTGQLFTKAHLARRALGFGVMALVLVFVRMIEPYADQLGPGTARALEPRGFEAQVGTWSSFLCWNPAELRPNIHWLLTENLAVLFGWKEEALSIGQTQVWIGRSWVWILLAGTLLTAALVAWRRRSDYTDGSRFCLYLMLVSVQAVLAYAALGCTVRDVALIRYTLLSLYFPIGLVTLFLLRRPAAWARAAVLAGVGIWGICSLADNVRFLSQYVRYPPPAPYRELANYLESHGVKYGRAPYWTAYQVDFLSRERITLGSFGKVRIQEYERIVDAHDRQSLHLFMDEPCPDGVEFRRWCLVYLDRARDAR